MQYWELVKWMVLSEVIPYVLLAVVTASFVGYIIWRNKKS